MTILITWKDKPARLSAQNLQSVLEEHYARVTRGREVLCSTCGGGLEHVFNDGPKKPRKSILHQFSSTPFQRTKGVC